MATTDNRGYEVPDLTEATGLIPQLQRMIRAVDADVDGIAGGGMSNPMTTLGDIIRGASAGAPQRLAVGSAGQVLTVVSGEPMWATPPADVGFANPMTTLGDVIYGGSSGVAARIAGNTTTTKKFLNQTGNGSVSAAPTWSALVAGDIPDLSGTYLTANQTITLSGDVTGSGSTAITATIAAQNSAFWRGKVSDETGAGLWVFNDTPTLITPILGVASGTSLSLSGNLTASAVMLDNAVAGIDTYDATPWYTGKVVKIRDSADSRDLGRLWVRSIEVGNDPFYSPGAIPHGGGNYLHNIRSSMLVSGDPNTYDKWEGITSWVNLDGLTASTSGTQDFYAFNGECSVFDAANTRSLWSIFGANFIAGVKGSGNINDAILGSMSKADTYGSGTTAKHRGAQGWARSMSGATGASTIAQGMFGLISNDASGYTMTAAVAVDALLNSNSGTIGSAYVIRARAETTGSGTVSGNRYGIYIADQNVGTVSGTIYNFYSAGSARLNRIEGELRVDGLIKAGSTPTTLTDSAGKILSASLNTVAVAQGGTGDTGTALTAYTPTVTSVTGTITTLGTVTGRYKTLGKMVFVEITIPITTNGTGASFVRATLPVTPNASFDYVLFGRETLAVGKMLQGHVNAAVGAVDIANYDNSYPGGNGYKLVLVGWYESA